MEESGFDFKIIFWVLAIGFYLYTQIKEAIKKGNKTQPIPGGSPMPQIPKLKPQSSPVTTSNTDPYARPSYKASVPVKQTSKRYQSSYNRTEERKQENIERDDYNKELIVREAFYKETHKQDKPVNYEEQSIDRSNSVFGVDEHLDPYALKQERKHPLLTFLSDKNNLRNAFITGEILKRPE